MNISKEIFQYRTKLLPSIWQLPNTLKIYEYKALVDPINVKNGSSFIDLGCGQGIQAQLLAAKGYKVLGMDPEQRFINSAKQKAKYNLYRNRLSFIAGHLEEQNFEPESFSSVISFCVMEHIPNLSEVLDKIWELLIPEGYLHATVDALSIINDQNILDFHTNKYKVVQYFTLQSLEKTLINHGFKHYEMKYILRSKTAEQVFIDDMYKGVKYSSLSEKKEKYKILERDEKDTMDNSKGLMILVRARKISR